MAKEQRVLDHRTGVAAACTAAAAHTEVAVVARSRAGVVAVAGTEAVQVLPASQVVRRKPVAVAVVAADNRAAHIPAAAVVAGRVAAVEHRSLALQVAAVVADTAAVVAAAPAVVRRAAGSWTEVAGPPPIAAGDEYQRKHITSKTNQPLVKRFST
jgi:hypothetical protein